MTKYPKRLIEVDLPIKRISAHARKEKSIRHGHVSTLHIWWARRPLAACRSVTCAALWPDPADELCPQAFINEARKLMLKWAKDHLKETICEDSHNRFVAYQKNPDKLNDTIELRMALLEFIADFAAWESTTNIAYLETSRKLTQSAHEALGGVPGTRPLVVDPFAGGGTIPLEALRVGADAFASDLNPIAVLLNKVVLEYIPKYGQKLADEVRKWGQWVKEQAKKELAPFYPKDEDGAIPIAYLWARTITCEGPDCGVTVPLTRSLWLAKKSNKSVAVQMVPKPEEKKVDFEIIEKRDNGNWYKQDTNKIVNSPSSHGTVARGSATCPCCGYTTPATSVRKQIKQRNGGSNDAQMWVVVTTKSNVRGRFYRLPIQRDLNVVKAAEKELQERIQNHKGEYSLVPNEPTPIGGGRGAGRAFSQRNYGMDTFADLFSARQLLVLSTLVKYAKMVASNFKEDERDLAEMVQTIIALTIDTCVDHNASLCTWRPNTLDVSHVFGRQALSLSWDFAEVDCVGNSTGSFIGALNKVLRVFEKWDEKANDRGHFAISSATHHPLADNMANYFFTDPPYYDAIPYSDLSDFFYVWLKRSLPRSIYKNGFVNSLAPKDMECVLDEVKGHDKEFFEKTMYKAMEEGRRVLAPDGIGTVVFAHKSTSGWETQLQAMIDAGWVMTGSWPIDTELSTRLRGMDSAALVSSVHIVCRPRENEDGSVRTDDIGDWREVLGELPGRIKEWMVRLSEEGVVGADAIFACIGPALEIFSRYSKVEKANGEQVMLREYLEQVWAAVSNEALEQVFKGANTSGFEEDARLTAMWLWTLGAGGNGNSEEDSKTVASTGYTLEYDAARKIAQGLGAHLEELSNLVEVKGDKARLLPVSERADYLFGKEDVNISSAKGRKKKTQPSLFDHLEDFIEEDGTINIDGQKITKLSAGQTTLDRIHQAMLLFAAGRSEAVRRFLVDDGVGADSSFWTLAQAMSALYPSSTEEKRWIDGILVRKKGLGF